MPGRQRAFVCCRRSRAAAVRAAATPGVADATMLRTMARRLRSRRQHCAAGARRQDTHSSRFAFAMSVSAIRFLERYVYYSVPAGLCTGGGRTHGPRLGAHWWVGGSSRGQAWMQIEGGPKPSLSRATFIAREGPGNHLFPCVSSDDRKI